MGWATTSAVGVLFSPWSGMLLNKLLPLPSIVGQNVRYSSIYTLEYDRCNGDSSRTKLWHSDNHTSNSVSASSVTAGSAFGTPSVVGSNTVSPSSLSAPVSIGIATLQLGELTLSPQYWCDSVFGIATVTESLDKTVSPPS